MSDKKNKDLNVHAEDEDDDDIVVLENEAGEEIEFQHLGTIDYKEKWYILLQPLEKTDDLEEDDVVIFEMVETENGDDFVSVEDEEILNAVYDEFLKECEKDDE
jgi:uncharacterized protein YrzB (UPF0473 family)